MHDTKNTNLELFSVKNTGFFFCCKECRLDRMRVTTWPDGKKVSWRPVFLGKVAPYLLLSESVCACLCV